VGQPAFGLAGDGGGGEVGMQDDDAGCPGWDRFAVRQREALPAAVAEVGGQTADEACLGRGESM